MLATENTIPHEPSPIIGNEHIKIDDRFLINDYFKEKYQKAEEFSSKEDNEDFELIDEKDHHHNELMITFDENEDEETRVGSTIEPT
jgi:hypothetical protein